MFYDLLYYYCKYVHYLSYLLILIQNYVLGHLTNEKISEKKIILKRVINMSLILNFSPSKNFKF